MKSHIEINSLGPCDEKVRLGCALKNLLQINKSFSKLLWFLQIFSKLTKFHTCKAVPPNLS